MRRSKEFIVLLVLLIGAMAFVLWYVRDRKARQAAEPPDSPKIVGPVAPSSGAEPKAEPVNLAETDGKTVDFSSGKPVVKQSDEDKAAIAAAKKDMDAALAETSFGPAPKTQPPKK